VILLIIINYYIKHVRANNVTNYIKNLFKLIEIFIPV